MTAAVLLAGLACAVPAHAAAPNVVVVVTDDQPVGTMRAMPKTREWFGENGRRFKKAYATTPLCCPSRASILSGRYAHNHGQHLNTGPTDLDQGATFVRYLHDAGYRTAIVGKYLNTWQWPESSPPDPPPYFDQYTITPGGYYHSTWSIGGKLRTVAGYSTTFTRRKSVRFIRDAEDEDSRPWLLYVATSAPHADFGNPANPYPVEEKYEDAPVGRFPRNPATEEKDLGDKPPFLRDFIESNPPPMGWGPRPTRRGQLRMLMSVDDMVAAIVRALAANAERRKTLIVFVSDNGLFWDDHQIPPIKDLPYPAAVRIPMLASWPGHIRKGSADPRLVANIDIAPTIMDAAGLNVPSGQPPMDGRSLLDSDWMRDRILIEYFGLSHAGEPVIPPWAGLITPSVQFNYYRRINDHPRFLEYYDKDEDPWQLSNPLGTSSPDDDPSAATLQGLLEQLGDDLTCRGTTGTAACP